MVPGNPRKLLAVRAQAGAGVKIVSFGQHLRGAIVKADRHQRIDHLRSIFPMSFDHTNESVAVGIENHICVTPGPGRGQGSRRCRLVALIETLIGEIHEPHTAVADQKSTAAVFVGTGTDVEGRGRHVPDDTIAAAANEDVAPSLRWSAFQPVSALAVEGDAAEAYAPRHQHPRRYGRRPFAVGGNRGHVSSLVIVAVTC